MAEEMGGSVLGQETVGRAAEEAESMGQRAKDKIKCAYDSAKEQIHETMESLRGRKFNDLVDDVSTYVKENPGKVLLISFGLGIAAGMLMRNKNSHQSED